MEKDIKFQNLHLHCRACLALCDSHSKYDVNEMPRNLLKLFKKCPGLRRAQNDFYPKSICQICFDSLKSFDEFQEKTKEATNCLNELLKSYKPDIGEVHVGQPDESSLDAASESSLSKSEGFQASINDSDDDPLQWVQAQSELSDKKGIEIAEEQLEQKEESDFESILVKTEIKEADESFKSEKQVAEAADTDKLKFSESDKETLASKFKQVKKQLKCKICEENFENTKALKNHMQEEHDKEARFTCDQCDRGFNRRWRLSLHQKEVHAANPVEIACKFGCGKTFRRAQTAANHYRLKHASAKVDTTEEIEIATSEVQSTATTIVIEKLKTEFPIRNKSDDETDFQFDKDMEKLPKLKKKMCTICFGFFSNSTALRKHMNTHQDVRPFQCDKCERGFNCKSRLQKHIKELHSENPVEFNCKFGCGKAFKTSDSAGNHYRRYHSGKVIKSEQPTCICEDCGRAFKCMTRLKQHSYQHRPIEDRPFHCEVCNKRFVFKKTYKEHLMRHKGIKDFECPQCGLKKTTKQELRNHMKYHTNELKTPCPLCNKIFGNPPNLRRHIQLVHEGVKNFKCRFCDEAFGKAETLKHHEMRHTGEKPHKCEICDKSFIQLVALRTHMKTHNKLPRASKANRPPEVPIAETVPLLDISESSVYA